VEKKKLFTGRGRRKKGGATRRPLPQQTSVRKERQREEGGPGTKRGGSSSKGEKRLVMKDQPQQANGEKNSDGKGEKRPLTGVYAKVVDRW